MTKKIKVLLVEDNPADSLYVQEILPSALYDIETASRLSDAKTRCSDSMDIILLDLTLPDGIGLDTFLTISCHCKKIPIIILTGLADQDIALKAVKLGAQDYILKKDLTETILERSINYSIERMNFRESMRLIATQASEAEANLRMALNASHTGVWYYDFAQDTLEIDEQARLIFGLPLDTPFSYQLLFEMVHPDDRERIEQFARMSLEELHDIAAEYQIIAADGEIRRISSSGKMFFDENNNPVRIAGTFRDVTELRMEEERERRLCLLEQREDFMATLTHDLKTPLIAANWILQAIAEQQVGPVTDEQEKLLFQLRDTNRTLLSMIQNLIELYRFERDVGTLVRENVQLADLIDSCLTDLSVFLHRRRISVERSVPKNTDAVFVDRNAIRRVLQNILDNAVKFTPDFGTITIEVEESKSEIVVKVTDTGPGIAHEEQSRLFKRFSQGRAGRTYTPGTGLGLYLCKQIIDAHQGYIECRSELAKGTTFSFRLPRMEPQAVSKH